MCAPQMTKPAYGVPSLLKCPRCGFSNLHQSRVEIFARSEDQPTKRVTVDQYSGDLITASGVPGSENPSLRRQALQIRFACEHGCPTQLLVISQHKGTTEIFWQET